MLKREQICLATLDPEAAQLASGYGLSLEISEYCTAWNMDEKFAQTDAQLQPVVAQAKVRVLHAPFNELFPCAIDPQARQLAAKRYQQAIALAKYYGAEKVVIHGGYNPWIYYPVWYQEQSVAFWKEFLAEDPGVQIVLENVLEEVPDMLFSIVQQVDAPWLRLCLDIGHAHAYSRIPVMEWLEQWVPYLSHFHIHNNDGSADTHCPLDQGTIPMKQLLAKAEELCCDATFTLELTDAASSVRWMFA